MRQWCRRDELEQCFSLFAVMARKEEKEKEKNKKRRKKEKEKLLKGLMRVELMTLCLLGIRSNQLSYKPFPSLVKV